MPWLQRTWPAWLPLLIALACVLTTVGIVACGDDDGAAGTTPSSSAGLRGSNPPSIISSEDVDAAREGTPERTVLSWFQAIQFRDISAAAQLVDPPVLERTGRDVLAAAVTTVGRSLGKPTFVASRRRGDDVALRTLITGYSDGKPSTSEAVTLYLRNRAGQWRMASLDYLIRSSDAIAAAARSRP